MTHTQTTFPPRLTGCTEVDHDVEPGTPEWQRYATGSKIAPILGVSPYTTRLQQWRHMTGQGGTTHVSDHMRWGTDREPVIRLGTAEALRLTIHTPRMLVSDADPQHAYSPDGILADGRLWEAKTATLTRFTEDWDSGAKVPAYYLAQVQWGLYVTGLDEALVTVEWHDDFTPLGTKDLTVLRDDDWIGDAVGEVDAFLDHVRAGTPPPPIDAAVVTDKADRLAVKAWAAANAQRLEAEKRAKETRPVVDRLGRDAAALVSPDGEVLCHWTTSKRTTETIDWDAIATAHPDLVEQATSPAVDRDALRALLTPEQLAAHTHTTTTTTRSLRAGSPA